MSAIVKLLVLWACFIGTVTAQLGNLLMLKYGDVNCTGDPIGFVVSFRGKPADVPCQLLGPPDVCIRETNLPGVIGSYIKIKCSNTLSTDQMLSASLPGLSAQTGIGRAVYYGTSNCTSANVTAVEFTFSNGSCPGRACTRGAPTISASASEGSTGIGCGKITDQLAALLAGTETYISYPSISSEPSMPLPAADSESSNGPVFPIFPPSVDSGSFSDGIYSRIGGSCQSECVNFCLAHVNVTVSASRLTVVRFNGTDVKQIQIDNCQCPTLIAAVSGNTALYSAPNLAFSASVKDNIVGVQLRDGAVRCTAFLKKAGPAATSAGPVVIETQSQQFLPGQAADAYPVRLTSELKMKLDTKGAILRVVVERKSAPPASRPLPSSATSLDVFYTIEANASQAVDAVLVHAYDDFALASTNASAKDLRWAYLKTPENVWVSQPSSVNVTGKTVSCQTTHFSEWTVFASVSTVSSAAMMERSPILVFGLMVIASLFLA